MLIMSRLSPQRFNPRVRPWLALWLLPYLVLSIVATGHNHGFGEPRDGASVAALTAASQQTTTADAALTAASEVAHGAHELWCLACQWAGYAAAIIGTPLLLTFVAVTPLFAFRSFARPRRVLARATVRGPPSL